MTKILSNKLCIYTKKCLLTRKNKSQHIALLINTHNVDNSARNKIGVEVFEILSDNGKTYLLSSDLNKEFYDIEFIDYD